MPRFLCFENLQRPEAKIYVRAPRLGRPLLPFVLHSTEEPPTKKARREVLDEILSDEGELPA